MMALPIHCQFLVEKQRALGFWTLTQSLNSKWYSQLGLRYYFSHYLIKVLTVASFLSNLKSDQVLTQVHVEFCSPFSPTNFWPGFNYAIKVLINEQLPEAGFEPMTFQPRQIPPPPQLCLGTVPLASTSSE